MEVRCELVHCGKGNRILSFKACPLLSPSPDLSHLLSSIILKKKRNRRRTTPFLFSLCCCFSILLLSHSHAPSHSLCLHHLIIHHRNHNRHHQNRDLLLLSRSSSSPLPLTQAKRFDKQAEVRDPMVAESPTSVRKEPPVMLLFSNNQISRLVRFLAVRCRPSFFAELNEKKFSAQEIKELMKGERNVPLIIDFYATWCGPCILMDQEIEMEEVITFFYVDLQWNPRTTITFGFAAKKEGDKHSFKLLMIPTELMLCFETQFQTLLCGLIGLPPSNGVLPQSPMHTKSLAVLKKQVRV
ncbi:HCO3- transporter family [Trifolium repens]|nr:HCO3- transporter family [Trifolium repens]